MEEKKTRDKGTRNKVLRILLIVIVVPLILLLSWKIGDRKYYLFSSVVLIISVLVFFLKFERRKPQAREMVTLAVMAALAAAARSVFVMLPHYTPMTGIVMITGIALGPEAGFLTGAIGALVSNFVFGQGPWTPWQMFAYGLAGLIAGGLARHGIIKAAKRIPTAIWAAVIVFCIIGPFLDTATLFLESMMVNAPSVAAVYAAGVPVNAIHAASTFLTVLIFCKPLKEKLERLRTKYGIMEEDP